ncbi:hypothetical protein QFC21_006958 [Naganishia friedmannii]|uniref:Uncharacterized protein n=1 Tax=Naganishia friedmannii TaxID=89922 RepID=A0ACC2UZ07_9TREE|nr:hypothetical protein QFC21_006958 [Naganishia friedmannii]
MSDKLTDLPSVTAARKRSSVGAVKKLTKYLNKFLRNKWVCMAYALDPTVRDDGLRECLAFYGLLGVFDDVLYLINNKLLEYKEEVEDQHSSDTDDVRVVNEHQRPNKFASARIKAGKQVIDYDREDPWQCYNSGAAEFATIIGEPVLHYWRRMYEEKEM